MQSQAQRKPLKHKTTIFQKLKDFFNDIPDNQNMVVNEASQSNPPKIPIRRKNKTYSLKIDEHDWKNSQAGDLNLEQIKQQLDQQGKEKQAIRESDEDLNY